MISPEVAKLQDEVASLRRSLAAQTKESLELANALNAVLDGVAKAYGMKRGTITVAEEVLRGSRAWLAMERAKARKEEDGG